MSLSDTLALYNFVIEEKKKGIAIRETLRKHGVSTNQFYHKCKKLNLKKWSDQSAEYIRINNEDNEQINNNLGGGSVTNWLDQKRLEHNARMEKVSKIVTLDITENDKEVS